MLKKLFLSFVCLSFVFSIFTHNSYAIKQVTPKILTAKVYKIVDGDTLWATYKDKKFKIRLLYVDTPEKFTSNKMIKDIEKCHVKQKNIRSMGVLASRYVKKILHKNQLVTIKSIERDYYGRVLAEVFFDDQNLNELLVKEGYACVYKNIKDLEKKEYYQSLLNEAKTNKKGLWKDYYEIMECLCK